VSPLLDFASFLLDFVNFLQTSVAFCQFSYVLEKREMESKVFTLQFDVTLECSLKDEANPHFFEHGVIKTKTEITSVTAVVSSAEKKEPSEEEWNRIVFPFKTLVLRNDNDDGKITQEFEGPLSLRGMVNAIVEFETVRRTSGEFSIVSGTQLRGLEPNDDHSFRVCWHEPS
jgi:hypothetical protein